MTTIAAVFNRRQKSMAADSFVCTGTDQSSPGYTTAKIVRIGDSLVGCAGPSAWCRQFIEWRMGQLKRPPKFAWSQRFEAMIMNQSGLWVLENDCKLDRIVGGSHAIGSGSVAAKAVLLFGGTPVEAVGIACQLDPFSKEPILALKL